MQFVSVCNWSRFQHYKNRDPTWVKLHRSLLTDYAWSQLDDSAKGHLIGIWLMAAKLENRIPADPVWLANQIGATDPIDLDALISASWLQWVEPKPASDVLEPCYQPASDVLADEPTEGTTGEQSPRASDVLALPRVCGHPPAHSRETETEREKERENLGKPSGGREAGAPPSFLSFNQEQREQVDALARLRLAKRSEQA